MEALLWLAGYAAIGAAVAYVFAVWAVRSKFWEVRSSPDAVLLSTLAFTVLVGWPVALIFMCFTPIINHIVKRESK